MILEDIVKELANRINQPHVIRTYLLKVRNTAYKLGIEEGKKQCSLAHVSGQWLCYLCRKKTVETEDDICEDCRD